MATLIGSERFARFDTVAEATPGAANASPTFKPFRMAGGGGSGWNFGKQTIATEEEANVTAQPAPTLDTFNPTISTAVIPSPWDSGMDYGTDNDGFLRWLLEWFFTRTSGLLDSHTFELCHTTSAGTGIQTQQFLGCKPATLTLTTSGGLMACTLGMQALNAGRRATAITATGTFPSERNWKVRNIGFMIGDDLTPVGTNSSVRDVTIEISNNLAPGPPQIWRPKDSGNGDANETNRYGIAYLAEGQLTVTGSLTIDLEDSNMLDRTLEDLSSTRMGLRLLAFHSGSAHSTTTGAETSGPTDPEVWDVQAGDGSNFVAGDVLYLEDSDNADPESWIREVLELNSVATDALSIETGGGDDNSESDGRSQSFGAGSHVFSKGLQIRIPQAQITGITPTAGAGDRVGQTVSFQAEIPTSSAPQAGGVDAPMGFLVR